MTQDEIIELAKASLKKDVIYHRDGIELEWADLIDFFHAAQLQAYERAAEVCEIECGEYFDSYELRQPNNNDCANAIRALIEGDGK